MAAKKRKTAKKPVKKTKRPVKKAVRKAAARKAPARKAAAKPARKAAPKKAKRPAKKAVKKTKNREFGEGNYKASKRFRKSEEAFVKAHKAEIPALGKAAEAALEGPEGETLRAAEAEAAGHAAGEG